MSDTSPADLTGTRLRRVHELLDGDVAAHYGDLGVPGFAPRYTPIARVLRHGGPASIREIADALELTHSAVSQTVSRMAADGFVEARTGEDARRRIVHPTSALSDLYPVLDAEWDSTLAALRDLESELSFPLSALLIEVERALARKPFIERIREAARGAAEPAGD